MPPDHDPGLPPDPIGNVRAWAANMHETFLGLQGAGFTEDQAFDLVREIVRATFTPK